MSTLTTKNQVEFINLKPATNTTNTATKITVQPPNSHPLSISQIDSFPSDDDNRLTTPPPPQHNQHQHQQLQRPKLTDTNSKKAKRKLQRIISRRFNTDKPLIQRALSQFLIDEEFDAKAMKTDLKDSDGYIIDHLANKFNWNGSTRQQFFSEITDALTEDEISRSHRISRKNSNRRAHDIIEPDDQSIFKTDTQRTGTGIHEEEEEEEEEHKYNSSDNITLNMDTQTSPEIRTLNDSFYNNDTIPLKSAYSVDTETTAFSNDDNDDVGVNINLRSYTETSRIMGGDSGWTDNSVLKNKRTRYPIYVIKAIFYAADDEHVEVLLDQAINFIANDPRFNYLWHDEEFIKSVYIDKTFSSAVERLMREIQDIASNDDGADFFHQFVYREYDRERKDYLRNLLSAKENKSYHEKALAQEETKNNNNNNSKFDMDNMNDIPNFERVRTQSISKSTVSKRYTIKYLPITNNEQNEFDIKFKIRAYKKNTDDKNYQTSRSSYFELPNCAPGKKFMWAQYQRRKIKRFGKPNKAYGYWKLLKCEEEEKENNNSISQIIGSPSTKTGEMTELTTIIEEKDKKDNSKKKNKNKNKNKKKKQKKQPPVPVKHLNLILGLLRFYLKQKQLEKGQTWIWDKCEIAFNFKDTKNEKQKDDRLINKKDIAIEIDNIEYKISWYNGGDGFDECVALAIRKENDPKKFYFYLCFKAEIEDKIEWQWYNNDESYFQKYDLGFNVFAQLEASFQANLHTNFPFNIIPSTANKNRRQLRTRDSPFNLPCIPEMIKALKQKGITSAQHYIIRYLFTRSKRIMDMEQLSVNKNQPEYARRIKRMIAGTNQSTLFAYFLKSSDFVDEWKERFLLSEETQVYFFWSFILAIATTMKYMELELENQFITFSFRRDRNINKATGCINKLDTSDLRREMRDLDLFDGFIVPPLQIMQTQDVNQSEDDRIKPIDWYRRLSTVGILEKRIYYNNFGEIQSLHDKPSNERIKKNEQYDTCPHQFLKDQYPWKGKLGTLYCDRCANMMRFGEYLRKFCLEYENRELIQFLWPWHKNTFHMKDRQKYHEAITRQNFNFLFDSEDLLNYVPRESNKELIGGDDEQEDELNYEEFRKRAMSERGKKSKELKEHISIQKRDKKKVFEAHIRHKRKYAARFMLGAWESLKNLNIIKIQMGAVFEQLEIDRVHAEVANATRETIDIKFYQKHFDLDDNINRKKLDADMNNIKITEPKKWKLEPKDWPKWLGNWNIELKKRLQRNHWLMILKLNKFKVLDIATMSPKQLPNWDSFLTWALSPAYKLSCQSNTLIVTNKSNNSNSNSDIDSNISDNNNNSDSDSSGTDDNEFKTNYGGESRKTEATYKRQMENEWKKKFRQSWTRVPSWWHIGHDKVLIELAVQNQFNERKYYRNLTKRGAYFRMRLNESIGEQDYTQDVAFQEFKNWCIRWENIMHRVRYISAVVARQISSITPSIIEILIEDKNDRPTWDCKSLVFLNDHQKKAHIKMIEFRPKPKGFRERMEKKRLSYDEQEDELSIVNNNNNNQASQSQSQSQSDDDDEHLIIKNTFQNVKSRLRLTPKFTKTKTQYIEEAKADNMVDNKIDWAKLFKECRTRDPFMIRDLGFELKEILNTFDLVIYGEPMSKFVINILRTRNLASLWTFLGVLLKTMPNKVSLKILYNNRTQLRRANPSDLDWICRQVIQGTRFIVPACLFLSHFMKENARDDLARNGVWESYSKQYEGYAAEQVSSIEDDFMLAMLMFIPVYKLNISLIQLALEQHNTLFLNTERVNRMVTHTWFTANPLNPYIEMLSHTKNPKRNLRDAFETLLRKPIYFYLQPFGYQWCISAFFTVYVILVIVWMAINSSANHDLHNQMYSIHMTWFERSIWFMNLGFVFTEFVQFYTLRRAYFSVDGATNVWDITMSIIWCCLAGMRFWFIFGGNDNTSLYQPPTSSLRRRILSENNNNNNNKNIYCPPDFFSCKIQYNNSCIAEISSKDNEITDFLCDYNNNYNRRLQDSDGGFGDTNMDTFGQHDIFYDEETLSTSALGSGLLCIDVNYTIPYNNSEYFWNSTCLNFVNNTNTNITNNTSDCILAGEICDTHDTQLLLVYNVLWATQVCMLTIRLLSYYESAGGFFGILLRIVRAMAIEVLKFGVIVIIMTCGFLFAIWYLFSVDIASDGGFRDLYDVVIFFFKLLFGGGNVGTIDTFYQNYRVYAQIITMVFAILGVRMFMSLLIALMSGAMNSVRQKAKAETSFTSALYAYELSTSPRVMPMPLNVVVVIICFVLHILNFIPAMISPEYLNIYAYVNQKRLYGSGCCHKSSHKNEIDSINHMNTRRRVFLYYITRLIPSSCCYICNFDWRIHHIGCYNTLTGIYGTEEIQAVSTNEYYSILETKRRNSEENRKLNVYDKLFLKHLTLKTLFCKFCFRPIVLEDVRSNLLTPFQALTNIISCYMFLIIWPFFIPFFWLLCQIEKLIQYWTEELRAHSPTLLASRQREYDLEYFPRSAVKSLSVRNKTQKDLNRLGTGGPDVTDVDVNYDEMDDSM